MEEKKEDKKGFKINVVEFENEIIDIYVISRISTTEEQDVEAEEGIKYLLNIHLKFPPYILKFGFTTDELRNKKKIQLLSSLERCGWTMINDIDPEDNEVQGVEDLGEIIHFE